MYLFHKQQHYYYIHRKITFKKDVEIIIKTKKTEMSIKITIGFPLKLLLDTLHLYNCTLKFAEWANRATCECKINM